LAPSSDARPVVAIFGPTASGKTAVAAALAEAGGGEVVSADSMQVYQGLPVLTAQPPPELLDRIPHHLVGIWPVTHAGSVGEYETLAHAAIDDVRARGRLAIVAGGTGLYLRAALAELGLPPPVSAELREAVGRRYDADGPEAAHALLTARDPAAAARVHPHDRRRVVRALELAEVGASLRPDDDRLWSERTRHPTRIVVLQWDPERLRQRIAQRTWAMLRGGAVEEVRRVLADGPPPSATADRLHGLDDIREHLLGRLTLEACAARLTLRVQQYARRQRIWARKLPHAVPLDGTLQPEELAARILTLA
jgi:tRNA dimethylallyltransferase